MNKDYRNFKSVDFVDDPFFQKWVYEDASAAAAEFWNAFVLNHPDKKKMVIEARQTLELMRDLKARQPTPEMKERAGTIKENIERAIHYPVLRTNSTTNWDVAVESSGAARSHPYRALAIAASLIIGAVALVFLLMPRSGFEQSQAEAQTVVHTSPKGKRTVLTLPDGTQVWLNAESRLIYLAGFENQKNREVFLEGEAFFDVAKDESKPFIVNTSSLAIKVLGTRFNVQSYDEDRTVATTLVEGKVTVSMIGERKNTSVNEGTALTANQRVVFIKESKKLLVENNVKAENYSDWRSGKLYFDDKPINEVLAMVERWYDVSIHVDNLPAEGCTFSAKIDNKGLVQVLDLFKAATGDHIHYKIKGKDVFISGKLCQ